MPRQHDRDDDTIDRALCAVVSTSALHREQIVLTFHPASRLLRNARDRAREAILNPLHIDAANSMLQESRRQLAIDALTMHVRDVRRHQV